MRTREEMKTNCLRLAFVLLSSVSVTASCAKANNDANNGADKTKARVEEILSKVDLPYKMFTLDNGLTVIVRPDKTASSVYVSVNYLVGSKDEPPGKSGFAHLFEHLMFGDTVNRKGDYFSPLQEVGVLDMNGFTTPDQTTYYQVVPAAALDTVLWLESDRMMHLLGAIDKTAIDNQRDVVKNEKREGEANIRGQVEEAFLKALYPVGHPYHHSTIGSMQDLDNASLEDVKDWFRQYYGASNAVLVISGGVDAATVEEKVNKYFAAAPAGKPLVKVESRIPELGETKQDVLYDATSTQTRISLVWPLPPTRERDTTLMDFVATALGGSENSPLKRKLIDEQELATEVSAQVQGGNLASTLSVDATLAPGADLDKLRHAVDQGIAEFLEAGPNQKLLDAAKLSGNIAFFTSANTFKSGAILEASYLASGDPEHYKKEVTWANQATPADIRDVARKWMKKPRYELTILPFPEYVSAAKDVDRSAIPSAKIIAQDPAWPALESTTLDNGIKLVVAKKGEVPMEYVSVLMDTGDYADGSKPGAADLTMAMLDQGGAGDRSPTELDEAIESIGGNIAVGNQGAYSRLDFSALTPYFDDSLSIAADMLMRPRFSADELKKQKTNLMTEWKELKADPAGAQELLFYRAIYGADNVKGRIPTPEDYSRLTRDDIVEFHRREVSPQNMTIVAIGGMDPEEVKAKINEAFGKWRGSGATSQQKLPGPALADKKRIILVDKPDAQQSSIMVGQALPLRFDPKTRTTLEFANLGLGGDFTSRLNMNIREEKGWSYGIRSSMGDDVGGGQFFVVSGNVQTDKTKESMMEIDKELRDFITKRPMTEDELETFRQGAIRTASGSYDSPTQFLGSMMQSYVRRVPLDSESKVVSQLEAPTLQDVNAMARQVLKPDALTWVIVGDLKTIEGPVRSLKTGEVEVWDAYGKRVR